MIRLVTRTGAADRAIPVIAIAALAACTASPAPAPDVAVRDSAGVVVVGNAAEAEERAPRWAVSGEPRLRIGVAEGPPEYELSHVRGVVSFPDEIVVLNAGSHELRFFDRQGRHLRSVGRQGAGPGEFQAADRLFRLDGDSLAVFDLGLGRISIFESRGEFARLAGSPGPVFPIGFLDSNRVVTEQTSLRVGLDSPELVVRNHSTLQAVALATGETRTLVDSVPGRLLLQSAAGGQPSFTPVPFSQGATIRIAHGQLYIVDPLAPEVRIYDVEGRLARVVRVLRDPQPVSAGEFTRIVEERVAAVRDPPMRAEFRRRHEQMPIPEARPSYSDLLVTEDELWLRHFTEPSGGPSRWTVFSLDGAVKGSVTLPAEFTPSEVRGGSVLGVRRDELGIEYVEELELQRQ